MIPSTLGLFGNIGLTELLIIGFVGLLIFGKRLPEVGKNLGKSIVEFKRGLSGAEEDLNKNAATPPATHQTPAPSSSSSQNEGTTTAVAANHTKH